MSRNSFDVGTVEEPFVRYLEGDFTGQQGATPQLWVGLTEDAQVGSVAVSLNSEKVRTNDRTDTSDAPLT